MVPLIPRRQPRQDVPGLGRGGLLDLHPPEPPLQGGVLLDMGPELLVGGGADHLQLAPGQHRLQNIGRVDGAFGGARPHDGVELVHKQDDPAVPHQLFQQAFQPLLEVAPVLGARHQAGHIQCQQPPAFQGPGHLPRRDPLGQALGQGGLAHPGLPHQAGVVLLAPAQNLDHPVQLLVPAEHRVQLPFRRAAGQVPAIFIAGPAAPGHAGGGPGLDGQCQLPRHLAALPHRLGQLHPHGGQQHPRPAAPILQDGAEQVFRLGFQLAGVAGVDQRIIHGPPQLGGQILPAQAPGRALAGLGQLAPHLLFLDVLPRQKPAGRAPLLLEDGQQQVAGIRPVTTQIPRQLDGAFQHLARIAGKAFAPSCSEMFQKSHGLLQSRRCAPLCQVDEAGSRRWRSAPVFASGHRPAPQKPAKRKRRHTVPGNCSHSRFVLPAGSCAALCLRLGCARVCLWVGCCFFMAAPRAAGGLLF